MDRDRRGYVYVWINTINEKWYIGSHNGSNPNYKASGEAINAAFEKYGIQNFICRKFYCENYREVEDRILKKLDAANDRMSYNLKNSAVGGDTSKNIDYSKLSVAMKGRSKSTEHKLKIGAGNRGTKRPDLSERNRNSGRKCSIDGVTYASIAEAMRRTGLTKRKVYDRI